MNNKVVPTDDCAHGLVRIIEGFYAKHPELLEPEQEERENDDQKQTCE